MWKECQHRHKLVYIDGKDIVKPSENLMFGTHVHALIEEYVRHKFISKEKINEVCGDLVKLWQEAAQVDSSFTEDKLIRLLADGFDTIANIPSWLDKTFGKDWKCIEAEEELYEKIDDSEFHFKGFIDAVIDDGKDVWLLDWKTSGRGWSPEKRAESLTRAQLIFYEHYWKKKHPESQEANVRIAFVVVTKHAKQNKFELIEIRDRSEEDIDVKSLSNVVARIKESKFSIKNRSSCFYCQFQNTSLCTLLFIQFTFFH